jgi:hypothetical protein
MSVIPAESQVLIPLPSFRVTSLGLILRDVPEYDEWCAMGLQLQGLARSIHWLAGDWLNIGEREYGETYVQAIDATGYSAQTLMNDKWVASRIEISRRRENLSHGHHCEVASQPEEVQDYWLDQAEMNGWSRDDLRKAIKAAGKEETEEPPKRISLLWDQVADLALQIEQVLDKAPELQGAWDWLARILEEEEE